MERKASIFRLSASGTPQRKEARDFIRKYEDHIHGMTRNELEENLQTLLDVQGSCRSGLDAARNIQRVVDLKDPAKKMHSELQAMHSTGFPRTIQTISTMIAVVADHLDALETPQEGLKEAV